MVARAAMPRLRIQHLQHLATQECCVSDSWGAALRASAASQGSAAGVTCSNGAHGRGDKTPGKVSKVATAVLRDMEGGALGTRGDLTIAMPVLQNWLVRMPALQPFGGSSMLNMRAAHAAPCVPAASNERARCRRFGVAAWPFSISMAAGNRKGEALQRAAGRWNVASLS
jgi:hypothetical protein